MDVSGVDGLIAELQRGYPFLSHEHARRLARAYGTRAIKLLGDAKSAADLGQAFGATLTEREVRYLMANEWARHGRRHRLAPLQARPATICRRGCRI